MADIGGDAWSSGDIVEGELGDEGVELHEEGEGLADAASGAEDGDLTLRARAGGEVAGVSRPAKDGLHGSEHRRPHLASSQRSIEIEIEMKIEIEK